MKMNRKILVITTCVLLLLSVSLVSFAIPTSRLRPLLSGSTGGYRYNGFANVSGKEASATLLSSLIEDEMHVPPYDCASSIYIEGYSSSDRKYGSTTCYGDTYVAASFAASGDQVIYYAKCSFKLNGANLGEYTVYAD